MGRLTITLDDDLHGALKETAIRRKTPTGPIINECLRLCRIRDRASARSLVAAARKHARLSPADALKLAVEETRAARER